MDEQDYTELQKALTRCCIGHSHPQIIAALTILMGSMIGVNCYRRDELDTKIRTVMKGVRGMAEEGYRHRQAFAAANKGQYDA